MDQNYDEFGNYVGPESESESDFDSDEEEQDDEPHEEEPAPGDEPLESVVANEEEMITPGRKLPFEIGVDSSSFTHVDPKFLVGLMCNPDLIRNLALVGHLHHGKTIFLDMLVEQTHQMSTFDTKREKHMRFTDTRFDEQERGISVKAVPMSLVLQDSKPKSYLCNIMDTPGHVDFSDEMTAALRLADGAVLVVDAAEGVRLNTERAIRHAIEKDLPIVVVINKVDRLITELRLPPKDAYDKLCHTIEVINNNIAAVSSTAGKGTVIDPSAGNVCFASATDGWSFTLQSYARLYSKLYGTLFDTSKLAARLWGDMYFDRVSRTFQEKPPKGGGERSFVQFILEPLYKLYTQVIGGDKRSLETALKELGVTLPDAAYKLNVRPLLRLACSRVFGPASGFTDMLVEHIPSPKEAARWKVDNVYRKPDDSLYTAMIKCDSSGPLMLNVPKLYPKPDCSAFYAFGRVYSGEIKTGQSVKVLGERYLEDEEDMTVEKVTRLWVHQGRYKLSIPAAPPGSWVLIEGVDASIMKTATLCDANYHCKGLFRPLKFNTVPVVKIAIEPLIPSELPQMLEGLRKISKSYPLAITKIEERGECNILGTGELYLDSVMKDLRELYSGVEVKVADPFVSFRETVVDSTVVNCFAESENRLNKIRMVAEPLERLIVEDIENAVVNPYSGRARRKFFEAHGWDANAAGSVWAFGPDGLGPNILRNDTRETEVDKGLLGRVKKSIEQGFQLGTLGGPLCGEPMRNVTFKLADAKIAAAPSFRGLVQIVEPTRRAILSSFLMASPRLMEPVYLVEIQAISEDPRAAILNVLSRRRGRDKEWVALPGAQGYIMKAYLPVIESFGFQAELRQCTLGDAFCLSVFDHWDRVPGDPMDTRPILIPGQPAPTEHLARDFMVKTRRRKGMRDDVKIAQFLEEATMVELAALVANQFN